MTHETVCRDETLSAGSLVGRSQWQAYFRRRIRDHVIFFIRYYNWTKHCDYRERTLQLLRVWVNCIFKIRAFVFVLYDFVWHKHLF